MNLDFNIRYEQVMKLLKINKTSKILEIGALPPACLSNYIGKEIGYLGINKDYSNYVYRIKKMDFLANNFVDDSFSESISIDTIEHVRKIDRKRFIDEMIRVTKNTIIIGVPNPEGREYEKTLVNLLRASKRGKHYIKFLKEHEKFGIPSKKEMHSYLLGYKYYTVGNFSLQYWTGIILSDVFAFDINLKKIQDINNAPTYRTFYIIKK